MTLRSTPQRYGLVVIVIHWVSAVMIIGLLVAGFLAAGTSDPEMQAAILRLHAPLGFAVLVLTLLRIGWWIFFDRKPNELENQPRLQAFAAKAVHGLMYVAIFILGASGIALMALSGAGDILFGNKPGPLPDFWDFAPRYGHAFAARLIVLLVMLHVGASLYHQFIRRDRILARMGLG